VYEEVAACLQEEADRVGVDEAQVLVGKGRTGACRHGPAEPVQFGHAPLGARHFEERVRTVQLALLRAARQELVPEHPEVAHAHDRLVDAGHLFPGEDGLELRMEAVAGLGPFAVDVVRRVVDRAQQRAPEADLRRLREAPPPDEHVDPRLEAPLELVF